MSDEFNTESQIEWLNNWIIESEVRSLGSLDQLPVLSPLSTAVTALDALILFSCSLY